MDFLKKLLVLTVFLIVLYILYRLIEKRRELIVKEGFVRELTDLKTPGVIAIASTNKTPNTITNMPLSYKNLKLSSVFIKSSFNTAYDGETVSTDMVEYILSRGYRFLDFEVYYEILTTEPDSSPTATVAVSEYGTYPRTSANNILLSDVFKVIQLSAFTTSSPNPNDPLFIQLRPMYQDTKEDSEEDTKTYGYNNQLNASIKQALGIFTSGNTISGPISSSTKLKDISASPTGTAKLVLVMDVSKVNNNDSLISRIQLTKNNLMTVFLPDDTAKPKQVEEKNKLMQLQPFSENNVLLPYNLNPYKSISMISTNIMPVLAWYPSKNTVLYNTVGDSTLGMYENIFIKNGNSAFVELSTLKTQAKEETRLNSNKVLP